MSVITLRRSTVLARRTASSPVRIGNWPAMRNRWASVGADIAAAAAQPAVPLVTPDTSLTARIRRGGNAALTYAMIGGTLAIAPVAGWLVLGTTGAAFGLGLITPVAVYVTADAISGGKGT